MIHVRSVQFSKSSMCNNPIHLYFHLNWLVDDLLTHKICPVMVYFFKMNSENINFILYKSQ